MNTKNGAEPCDMCGHDWHGLQCASPLYPRDPEFDRPAGTSGCGCPGPWAGIPDARHPVTPTDTEAA